MERSQVEHLSSGVAPQSVQRMRFIAMTDVHENPEQKRPIDAVGWMFILFVFVVTALAVIVALKGNDASVSNTPASHVAAPPD